jgi:hypothetical protein
MLVIVRLGIETRLPFVQYRVSTATPKCCARFLSHDTFIVLLYKILLSVFLNKHITPLFYVYLHEIVINKV